MPTDLVSTRWHLPRTPLGILLIVLNGAGVAGAAAPLGALAAAGAWGTLALLLALLLLHSSLAGVRLLLAERVLATMRRDLVRHLREPHGVEYAICVFLAAADAGGVFLALFGEALVPVGLRVAGVAGFAALVVSQAIPLVFVCEHRYRGGARHAAQAQAHARAHAA